MTRTEPAPVTIGINLVAARHCNARCYYAKSSDCSCVCNGRNHGIEREETAQTSIFDTGIVGPRSFTKKDFYRDKSRRDSEYELDFGAWWRDGRNYPVYRVSWIKSTGELYAIDQQEQRIELIGKVAGDDQVRRAMDGWEGICGLMNSLQWVRDRIKQWNDM